MPMKNALWYWLVAVILLASLAVAAKVRATALSGSELLEDCRNADANFKKLNTSELQAASYCFGYVAGVVDRYEAAEGAGITHKRMACIPDEVNGIELGRTVLHFSQRHPDKVSLQASELVLAALSDSFPCKD
jgi:Rap1a immunity proteins